MLSSIQDVDLRLLRVFQSVARHRGLTAAQQELGVTQATISTQLSQLENRLGFRLCDRGRGGFQLTDEGRIVLDATRSLFRSIETFRGTIGTTRGELTGEVYFGMVDAMWTNRQLNLQSGLADFALRTPKVVFHIDIASPQDLLQGLAEDRHHLILAPMRQLSPRFHGRAIFREQQSLYCGSGHPLFERKAATIDPKEIAEADYVARSYMGGWSGPLKPALNTRAIVSHMESLAILILSGQYIGYLPNHFAAEWEKSGQMKRLLDSEASYDEQFFLAYRSKETNRAVDILFECIERNTRA